MLVQKKKSKISSIALNKMQYSIEDKQQQQTKTKKSAKWKKRRKKKRI